MLQVPGYTRMRLPNNEFDGFETMRRLMLQVYTYMSVTLVHNIHVPVAACADQGGQHSGAVEVWSTDVEDSVATL